MFQVRVQNFQSIADATVVVDGFTVVTGGNNGGKSALMRAIRGAFQNTRGTAFIRRGQTKSTVTVTFQDGMSVVWDKGRGKGDKPTYVINNGSPIHPGQGVPDELAALGVRPISAGGREIWPQFAPQFTGQVFLLDQPGSVLADAVADVDRVGQLNEALRLSESDRRSAASDLRSRQTEDQDLQTRILKFGGLDDACVQVHAIEHQHAQTLRIEQGIQQVTRIRDQIRSVTTVVNRLAGILDVQVPDIPFEDDLREIHALGDLRLRLGATTSGVTRLTEVESIPVDVDGSLVDRIDLALRRAEDLRHQWKGARSTVDTAEQDLQGAEGDLSSITQTLMDLLGGMGECPVCGTVTGHQHEALV